MQPGRGGERRGIGCCSACRARVSRQPAGVARPSAAAAEGGAMGGRRWLLALLLLLWLALSPGSGGPLSEASDGKEPGEGEILNLVHPKAVRSAARRRQNGMRRYRRPRPSLSHKGPMPF